MKPKIRYSRALTLSIKNAYATYVLIGLNFLVFAVEIYSGGSEDVETLQKLGGLIPEAVWQGEWWRAIAANFLHFDSVHLLTNMLGLYFLGPFVEKTLGICRYLWVYFLSGVGTMVTFSLVVIYLQDTDRILVGASAAIMGVLGTIIAILLKGWLMEKNDLAAHRLCLVLFIVSLQVIVDLNFEQVSFLAHALGLGLGFTSGFLIVFLGPAINNWLGRFQSKKPL